MNKLVSFIMIFFMAVLFTTGSLGYANPYELSSRQEVTCLLTGGFLHLTGTVSDRNKSSSTLSDLNRLKKEDIPFFDRPYAGRWDPDAHKLSDVFLASSLVLPLTLFSSQQSDVRTLGIMYAETVLLTSGGVTLAKGTVTRYRPFTYNDKAPLEERLEPDAKRSFFSGHTTQITSSLIFSAKVYSDYYPHSPYRPYIWGAALIGSVYGGWLRIQAGMHFPSDIVISLIWGGLVGYSIPAFHRKNNQSLSLVPYVREDQKGAVIMKRF